MHGAFFFSRFCLSGRSGAHKSYAIILHMRESLILHNRPDEDTLGHDKSPINGQETKGIETTPAMRAAVRPCEDASVTVGDKTVDIRWTIQPSVQFNNPLLGRRTKCKQLEGTNFVNVNEILEVLSASSNVWKENRALPFARQDNSPEGTRGIRFISPKFPGKLVCITGVGVVKAETAHDANFKTSRQRFSIDPPQPDRPVSSVMRVGTQHVDSSGKVWSERNDSPFGAYDLASLRKKVERTATLGARFGPEIVAAGEYEGTNMGWMAYALPENALSPSEVLALDLQLPKEQEGSLYGSAVGTLLSEVREMHRTKIVHYQLHPGNWYFSIDANGDRKCTLTDWETAISLDRMPPENEFATVEGHTRQEHMEKEFETLTPQQRARAIDINNALAATTLIDTKNFHGTLNDLVPTDEEASWKANKAVRSGVSIEVSGMWVSMGQIEYQTAMLARAIHAYSGRPADSAALAETARSLQSDIKKKALALANDQKNRLYSGSDFVELVTKVDRSEWAIREAFKQLLLQTSRELVLRNNFS